MAQVSGVMDMGARQVGRAPLSFPSDANLTLTQAQYENEILDFGTGTALTATRDVIVPLSDGLVWGVYNGTNGAQSIRVIGASGTGITIANGKFATVFTDGVNVRRQTADV